jgi:hypothetical protein
MSDRLIHRRKSTTRTLLKERITKIFFQSDRFTLACLLIPFLLLFMTFTPVFYAAPTSYTKHPTGLFTSSPSNGTIQSEEWNMTFGGSNIDVGHFVQQTTDGGYIITGYTRSYGASGRNIWLIKTNTSGNEMWNTTYGGSNDEEGQCVRQTTDGGYIITGYTKSYGAGGEDLYMIKTDANGTEQWTKVFGGSEDDGGTSVQQTTDGGYILAGHTLSLGAGSVDAWLIKTDESGNEQWTKTFGGYGSDGAYCVQQTDDGGYILTGWTWSYGPGLGNVWLVKTDTNGNEQWNQVFGGTDVDRGFFVQQTQDKGYIITGYTSSEGAGLDDMLLIKTDSSGNEEWTKTYGGTGRDYGNSVQQTLSGGYIIAGYTLSYGAGSEDVWVVKTDDSGTLLWDETYGGTFSDIGYSIQQTTDGGYIVTGHTLSFGAGVHDVWLIKIASDETPEPLTIDAGGPYDGIVDEPVQFIGTVTGGVSPYTFHWNFGDNTTADEQSPIHLFTESGVYEAIFTVTDFTGSQAYDTALVTIQNLDTTPPEIILQKPQMKSLYLANKRICFFPFVFIIGSIDFTVEATDNNSGVESVVFSLNGMMKSTDTDPPYLWGWEERAFGRYTVTIEAYDNAGNNVTTTLTVWKIF